jgi:hypothetical protein
VLKVQHSTVERDQPGANAPDEPENHDGNSVDTDGIGAFTPVPNGTSSTVEASVDADDEELTVPNGTSSTDEDERVVDPQPRIEPAIDFEKITGWPSDPDLLDEELDEDAERAQMWRNRYGDAELVP